MLATPIKHGPTRGVTLVELLVVVAVIVVLLGVSLVTVRVVRKTLVVTGRFKNNRGESCELRECCFDWLLSPLCSVSPPW